MWIYRVTFDDDGEYDEQLEIAQEGEEEKKCSVCGLFYPARLEYPSGNSFFHEHSPSVKKKTGGWTAPKCRTTLAREGDRARQK